MAAAPPDPHSGFCLTSCPSALPPGVSRLGEGGRGGGQGGGVGAGGLEGEG